VEAFLRVLMPSGRTTSRRIMMRIYLVLFFISVDELGMSQVGQCLYNQRLSSKYKMIRTRNRQSFSRAMKKKGEFLRN
jgi:hypothetical protein